MDDLSDDFILAKSYFDCGEHLRCAHTLESCHEPEETFLKLYAKYISGEKKKEEEHQGILTIQDHAGDSSRGRMVETNSQLDSILTELEGSVNGSIMDPFLLYIMAIVHREQKNNKLAIERLIESLKRFPYNWSAWEELLCCIPTIDELSDIAPRLPAHLMTKIFLVYAQQELFQQDPQVDALLESLRLIFPNFLFLAVQEALFNYHSLNYNESEEQFQEILTKDPYRLDGMDIYSNILYVMERGPKLAFLAQLANNTDKFRPETCCIMGNYYSLKSQHEKAVIYYQRALLLDRNCLSAWTLMGHEFIELKNTHAAIESYRRAVDASNKDYRAWYGLGQAYEVLDMHYYSLYYYQRAAALKPMDVRMWIALGHCFDKLERYDEAIKAYKRALQVSHRDPSFLLNIATLYERLNDEENAEQFMRLCVAEERNEGIIEPICQARIWLAKLEMRRKNWSAAYSYAEGVTQGEGGGLTGIDEARSIIRELRNVIHTG
ncbi:anaphase promoting complex subunit CDC23 [Sugiyamaella lignohabitans]|uniref:Anaphase promoting complex subunit CDC23 n=1 Tax=Sugiyamaella lignohabitans TaxID=796027 RepID=A0A167FYR7_9ASCO|nr:anaphase promoting complex subunit CDC23 [Sugiyamaella lignohabitans]ANB15875.1 anaphase promoting complex subunit CDC23 [Sugiyamaella lignohabitans]